MRRQPFTTTAPEHTDKNSGIIVASQSSENLSRAFKTFFLSTLSFSSMTSSRNSNCFKNLCEQKSRPSAFKWAASVLTHDTNTYGSNFTAINMKYGPSVGDTIISTIHKLIKQVELGDYEYQSIGDTFIVYLALKDEAGLEKYASKLHEAINSHNWQQIENNLYVNSYTAYDFL